MSVIAARLFLGAGVVISLFLLHGLYSKNLRFS